RLPDGAGGGRVGGPGRPAADDGAGGHRTRVRAGVDPCGGTVRCADDRAVVRGGTAGERYVRVVRCGVPVVPAGDRGAGTAAGREQQADGERIGRGDGGVLDRGLAGTAPDGAGGDPG